MGNLTPTEFQALAFLKAIGADVMPRELESEEQMAAIIVFSGLKSRGLAINEVGDDTITWTLTEAGAERLAAGALQ